MKKFGKTGKPINSLMGFLKAGNRNKSSTRKSRNWNSSQ